jgi:formamidopyrimidine-DNA glycosylase
VPELPEVETIRRQLNQYLPLEMALADAAGAGREHYLSLLSKRKKGEDLERCLKIHQQLEAKEILLVRLHVIERFAKILVFNFEARHTSKKNPEKNFSIQLLSHLGMTGAWIAAARNYNEKHLHFSLHFKDISFHYIDPRRFGHLQWSDRYEHINIFDVAHPHFDQTHLESLFSLKRLQNKMIKPLLLDQSLFPGIGNYMASEVCALAGVHPQTRIHNLTKEQKEKILPGLKMIIDGQIAHKGLTFSGGYRDTSGEKGSGLTQLVVFHQKICGLCHTSPVTKITIEGRGTFYCPSCQIGP